MRLPLADHERRNLAAFVIVFGLTIVGWAFVHDLYLIGVEPRHFTEFHRPLFPITDPALLALQYATVATFGPGMVFGAVAFAVCRLGSHPPIGLRRAWVCFLPFVALIETSTLAVGQFARARHAAGEPLPYPAVLYPDTTAGIVYSQTVNITAYLAAAGFGLAYLVATWLRRQGRASTSAASSTV